MKQYTLACSDHWHVQLYLGWGLLNVGIGIVRAPCCHVLSVGFYLPFINLEIDYFPDGNWDDCAVWEPVPGGDCPVCGYENVQNEECAICGWPNGKD